MNRNNLPGSFLTNEEVERIMLLFPNRRTYVRNMEILLMFQERANFEFNRQGNKWEEMDKNNPSYKIMKVIENLIECLSQDSIHFYYHHNFIISFESPKRKIKRIWSYIRGRKKDPSYLTGANIVRLCHTFPTLETYNEAHDGLLYLKESARITCERAMKASSIKIEEQPLYPIMKLAEQILDTFEKI